MKITYKAAEASYSGRPMRARWHIAEGWVPACGTTVLLQGENAHVDPADVPEHRRCQRRGCKERWPQ